MIRPVPVLAAWGAVLGALGAVGWHWQPRFPVRFSGLERMVPTGGGPLDSGVIGADAIPHWAPLWWPAVVVLPLAGAATGAGLGVLGQRAVAALGPLVGIASALAWHYDPSGVWLGGLVEEVDVGYPAAGLAVGVIGLIAVRPAGRG